MSSSPLHELALSLLGDSSAPFGDSETRSAQVIRGHRRRRLRLSAVLHILPQSERLHHHPGRQVRNESDPHPFTVRATSSPPCQTGEERVRPTSFYSPSRRHHHSHYTHHTLDSHATNIARHTMRHSAVHFTCVSAAPIVCFISKGNRLQVHYQHSHVSLTASESGQEFLTAKVFYFKLCTVNAWKLCLKIRTL